MINLKSFRIPKLSEIHPKRYVRYQVFRLLRSPAGAKQVATGFSIGFGIEMLLPYTLYIGYILLFPFIFLKAFRSMLPPVVIGNLIGKASFLPALLVPIAISVSHHLFPPAHYGHSHFHQALIIYQHTLLVLSGFGLMLGIISYYLVYWAYQSFRKKRQLKRKERKERRMKQTM